MGIQNYWIVDSLGLGGGLGGRQYIGTPKQPTITVCTLVNGVYDTKLFRQGETMVSPNLSGFQLAVDQVIGDI